MSVGEKVTTVGLGGVSERLNAAQGNPGCVRVAREEKNAGAFGVAVIDSDNKGIDIVEKPINPPSNLASGGMCLFDERFWQLLDEEVVEKGEKFSIANGQRW